MSNKPVLITEASAANLRRGLREIRELGGTGQPRSRRRWPLDDSSSGGDGSGGAGRMNIVRVTAGGIHEGAEAGNASGPHLDVVIQAVTYPGNEPILFTSEGNYSVMLDAGVLPGVIRSGYFAFGVTISGETIEVVTAGSHWIIHNGDADETDYALRLNAQEHTDCYSASLKEVHYEDSGDAITAYPDARTITAMRGEASVGQFAEYALPLAAYVEEDQFYRAFASGLGWVAVTSRGARLLRLRVKSKTNDYLVCRTWDGATEGTANIFVAKPYMLRHLLTNYPNLTAFETYSTDWALASKEIPDTTPVVTIKEDWRVTPEYWTVEEVPPALAEWTEIYAVDVGATGVMRPASPNPLPVTLVDVNVDARAWAVSYTI